MNFKELSKQENLKEKVLVDYLNNIYTAETMSDAERFDALKYCKDFFQKKNKVMRNPGEQFRLVPGTSRFYASNHGRVLKMTSKGESLCAEIASKNKTNKIYYDTYIEFCENGEFYKARVRTSRIVAKTWIDSSLPFLYKDERVVDHRDNDSTNNKISNLQILSQRENINNAIYKQGRTVGRSCKKCYAYNIDNGRFTEYVSTAKLCEDIFGKHNNGYFNCYYKKNIVAKDLYIFGYDKDEILKIAEIIKARRGE